jgi:3',5'-cyclic AMP phosphodiesterase CpdA
MKTVVHLSDIHFGRTDDAVVAAIVPLIHSLAPDVLVVSGDLTQRAKPDQFRAARRFLDDLPKPQIVVPALPAAAEKVPPLHQPRPRAVLFGRRDRGGRHQHRPLADLQGRPDQRRTDAAPARPAGAAG